jgi:hypothetical protein
MRLKKLSAHRSRLVEALGVHAHAERYLPSDSEFSKIGTPASRSTCPARAADRSERLLECAFAQFKMISQSGAEILDGL